MDISKFLDTLLFILYDESLMQSNRLNVPEIIAFVKKKNNQYTDQQISFGITYLDDEDLASHSNIQGAIQRYSLTSKGIVLAASGGFKKKIKTEMRKSNLYKYGQWAVIVAGIYYAVELVKEVIYFHW